MRLSVLVAVFALAGCGPAELSPKEKLIADAQATIAADLKDPDSAKFRALVVYVERKTVCGEVNGKNGYGAYSGFSPFYYQNGFGQITGYDSIFYPRYKEVCFGAMRDAGNAALDRAAATAATLEDGPEKEALEAEIRQLRADDL